MNENDPHRSIESALLGVRVRVRALLERAREWALRSQKLKTRRGGSQSLPALCQAGWRSLSSLSSISACTLGDACQDSNGLKL